MDIGRCEREGFNVNAMRVRWGGKQEVSISIIIKEIGPYQRKLNIGDEEVMVFRDMDDASSELEERLVHGKEKVSNKIKENIEKKN